MDMFLDKPHEYMPPPVEPVSSVIKVSRTLIVLLVVVIAAGLGAVGWWYVTKVYQPNRTSNQNQAASPNTNVVSRRNTNSIVSSFVDADNDGLYDEAEILYGTDPRQSDTDSDGFADGEEVKHGYEPLIAEPGQRMIDPSLVEILGKSVASPIVVSSGMSTADRQRYYLVYDGTSTAYFSADGSLAAQCANDNEDGKCGTLPNEIRTDYSRTFDNGKTTDAFHSPF